jgi:hypothetical protein
MQRRSEGDRYSEAALLGLSAHRAIREACAKINNYVVRECQNLLGGTREDKIDGATMIELFGPVSGPTTPGAQRVRSLSGAAA